MLRSSTYYPIMALESQETEILIRTKSQKPKKIARSSYFRMRSPAALRLV